MSTHIRLQKKIDQTNFLFIKITPRCAHTNTMETWRDKVQKIRARTHFPPHTVTHRVTSCVAIYFQVTEALLKCFICRVIVSFATPGTPQLLNLPPPFLLHTEFKCRRIRAHCFELGGLARLLFRPNFIKATVVNKCTRCCKWPC
jgi:hypothetical protein